MTEESNLENEVIQFIRKRDYKFIRELGGGACGKTVLLLDETIDQYYVCKKYAPIQEHLKEKLYEAFVREIKLLHRVQHENVVRVFNHYLYPDKYLGYILMEYVEGKTIDEYVAEFPDKLDELFRQAVSGFAYLQQAGILHRDIRLPNLMVGNDGRLKIIDLGFGKRVEASKDFDKSIELNWWCETPDEFKEERYDFTTEVYFVGKLFEKLIKDNHVGNFKNRALLAQMCQRDPTKRVKGFVEIETQITADKLPSLEFDEDNLAKYRAFADELRACITKIENDAQFVTDIDTIEANLDEAYFSFMLEENVPNPVVISKCFLEGSYYYRRNIKFPVFVVRDFLEFFKKLPVDKKRIVLANIKTKLSSIPRYSQKEEDAAEPPPDLPF